MQKKDFLYELPEHYIAQHPLLDRSASKLLHLDKKTGDIEHTHFSEVKNYLRSGDILVLNNTKVIPARLFAKKEGSGGRIEIFLLQEEGNGIWRVLMRPSKRAKKGTRLIFDLPDFFCECIDNPKDEKIRRVQFSAPQKLWQNIEKIGLTPLPPYIKRPATAEDTSLYQTVYAEKYGAVAAPTAGMHFTESLIKDLQIRGITILNVTLHVGYGTFRPVEVENLAEHTMHTEHYVITKETAQEIMKAKEGGRRIIACGTTTTRALESAVNRDGRIESGEKSTNIFIYPPYQFKIIDGLITNFHLPGSTLLMLVSALAGRENVLNAYEKAKENNYRFFSYGDAMMVI